MQVYDGDFLEENRSRDRLVNVQKIFRKNLVRPHFFRVRVLQEHVNMNWMTNEGDRWRDLDLISNSTEKMAISPNSADCESRT
jgi:hypothetical protein